MVTEYFKNLFTDYGVSEPAFLQGAFPEISREDKRLLGRDVTRSEIFNAVNHMGALRHRD